MILTAAAVMVLVGCSSGGGGVSERVDSSIPGELNDHLGGGGSVSTANTQFDTAAKADPQPGSTTQSSEMEDRVGIADANAVSLSNGQIDSFTITNSGSGATWTEISTSDTVVERGRNADGLNFVQLEKEIAGGTLYLDAFTDIDSPIIRSQEATPQMLMVGDVYTLNAYFVMIDGILSELVCLEVGNCTFSQRNITYEFSRAENFAFIPEGTTTQISLAVGRRADGRFYREVELNGVLGTIGVDLSSSETRAICLTTPCTTLVERIGGAGRRITGFIGEHNFFPNGQTLVTRNDTDYLVGGTWLYIPEDSGETIEVGAFADGSEKLINLPLGQATYTGNAYGIRLTANTPSNFSADVVLTANFDTSTIGGMITGSELPSDLILMGENDNIVKEPAAGNFGSFDGDTNMEGGYAGKWGGSFYGIYATSAAGTFGVSKGTVGEDDFDSFVGYFGATTE